MDLYETTFTEIQTILQKYNLAFPRILTPMNNSRDLLNMYLEMTGIIKHFGHPCLKVEEGFETVREFGTEKVHIDNVLVQKGVSIFKRDFIKNYFDTKSRWPPLKNYSPEFKKSYESNLYPEKQYESNYELWAKVEFEKMFDYDYSVDTTELLKDSSSAQLYSQWFYYYDNCAFKKLYNKPKPRLNQPLEPTRVMERYLIGVENEVRQKVEEVENGYYNNDDRTAALCRKEQELKVSGRLFVKQTYKQRLMQTSMENNIAKQVMKFVPEQTMTDGELQQMRRLSETAKTQGEEVEIFNLDLSKWNLRFRHSLVKKYGKVIDSMFGLKNLYSTNHYWFLSAGVFHNSRLCPPDYNEDGNPTPGQFCYENHFGDMEGMRQKLWTIITISLIKATAEKLRINLDIMCQGDNQVVLIKYKPHQLIQKSQLRERFLTELSSDLKRVNLILKLEETWFSNRLCEFGKVRYFYGEAIGNTVKVGSKDSKESVG